MYITVYSDGASRRNPGPAGAGAILTDDCGNVVDRVCRYLGEATNNQAEYYAAIIGLEKALELGATRVKLKADSELLIKQVRGEYRVKNADLKPLHQKILFLLSQFERYDPPEHIPRKENHLADAEANRAIDDRELLV